MIKLLLFETLISPVDVVLDFKNVNNKRVVYASVRTLFWLILNTVLLALN